MRSYAVIPPLFVNAHQPSRIFVDNNGSIEDPLADYKEQQNFNVWSEEEKQIFREKYLQHPKNFGWIASFLEHRVKLWFLKIILLFIIIFFLF